MKSRDLRTIPSLNCETPERRSGGRPVRDARQSLAVEPGLQQHVHRLVRHQRRLEARDDGVLHDRPACSEVRPTVKPAPAIPALIASGFASTTLA